jgi:DNA-binding CsgD family transcriptional regulator
LRNLLLGAVQQLPERTQQVLRTVAEGGVQVGHALLRAVTGLDDAALTAALRPAVAANVLVGDADGYAFRHELFRDAVRGELLAGERIQVHRAFAETLEATPSLGSEAMPAVQRALHWRGACEYERAFVTAWHAAADAAASRAYGVRLGMLEQVLELWGRVPNAAKQIGADRVDVVGLAADAARWAGEPERGLTLVEAALGEGRDGERAASLLLRRAALRQQLLLPGQIDDLRAALRLVRGPTLERAQILGQLCRALLLRDRYGEAKQLAAEMRSLAAQLGDEECQTEALIALAQIATRQGADAVAALQEARAKAQRIGSGRLELMAWVEITHTLEGRGRHEHAIEAGREGLARARQLGLARYVAAPIAQNLAESLTSTGCWDEALEIAEEALSLDPAPFGRTSLLLCRAQITLARGDPETAARTVRELRALPASSAETQRELPLARLEVEWRLAQGDHAGALATAAGAVCAPDVDTDPRYLWPLLTTAMRGCAEAGPATVPGDIDDPAELRKILEQRAANTAADGPVERAHAAMFRAEASRAAGQPDPAAWDATAAAWESLGEPYPLAYALLRAAHAAAATGDRDTTINRLQRAAKLAGQLSAQLLLRQIRHLARRARIDLTADSAAAPTLPFGLTPRELEVLRLVAAGLSNRQIATELFISVKTASVHVSNILGKLGVPTRNEAAATAHRLHIFDAGTPDGPANPGLALRSPTSR